MFPFDIDDDDIEVTEAEQGVYREYGIDFETGQLSGDMVEGIEAVKVWRWLALQTDRYVFEQYSWAYGNDLNTIIGSSPDPEYLALVAERTVTDLVKQNRHITGLHDFKIAIDGDKMAYSFVVETEFGEVEVYA